MGKYSRLGKNTILVFLGNAGSKLIGLLMLPLYTRWLSVEDYGTTDIINVYVTFIMSIVSCCIAESLFIFPKDQTKEKQKVYFSSAIAFAVLALSVYALFSLGVAVWANSANWSNSFVDNVWLIYGLMAATMLQQMSQQFVRSIDRMKVYSLTGIVLTVFTALFSWMFIPRYGVEGYVWALIGANLLAALFSLTFSKAVSFFTCRAIEKSCLREMLAYSVPLIPNGIMWWLVGALNRPLMEQYLGMHSIGIFAVANKFPGIVVMVFNIFVTSWQISVIEEYRKEGFARFYNVVLRMVLLCLFVVFVGVSAFSKIFVELFASADFYEAWKYVSVLALGSVMQCLSGFFGTVFSAARISKYFFYSSVWGAVFAIGLNFVFIPAWGTMGAALATMFSFAAMALSRLTYSWRFVKVENIARLILSVAMFVLVPVLVLYVESSFYLWIAALTLLLVYLYCNKDVCILLLGKIKIKYLKR